MARASDLIYWFDVATHLLQRPLTEFPATDLAPHLHRSFHPTSLCWAWRETEDDYGVAHLAADGSRVRPAPSVDSDQQLPICYCLSGASHGSFVMTRGVHFDPEEKDLARRIRPLLAGLYAQVRVRARYDAFSSPRNAAPAALTGTEAAVLSLLAQGYTAPGIARRLSNSPRTVHKHLEHIYRKLGVSDRLMAVQVASDLVAASASRPPRARAVRPGR